MNDPKLIEHDPAEKPAEATYGWSYLFTIVAMSFGMAWVRDPEAVKAGLASWFGY